MPTLFESTLDHLGVKHKLIRPYTPRHNVKVERLHREDHNKFYSCQSNNLSICSLGWLSPIEFLKTLYNIRKRIRASSSMAVY